MHIRIYTETTFRKIYNTYTEQYFSTLLKLEYKIRGYIYPQKVVSWFCLCNNGLLPTSTIDKSLCCLNMLISAYLQCSDCYIPYLYPMQIRFYHVSKGETSRWNYGHSKVSASGISYGITLKKLVWSQAALGKINRPLRTEQPLNPFSPRSPD